MGLLILSIFTSNLFSKSDIFMNSEKISKTRCLDFSVESIVVLLWRKKWMILIITLLFVGLGVIAFKITKKPQLYKYTTEFTLQYQLDTGNNQSSWVTCERIPWKMVRVDYSKALSDSVFLEKLVAKGVLESSNSVLPVIVDSSDSLRLALSIVVTGESNSAIKLLSEIEEAFPSYVSGVQRDKLGLEVYLLDKKREQILATLTSKGEHLQNLLNKKNPTVVDRMEILRLENECQMLYNLDLDLMIQISDIQVFLKDRDLLVLRASDGIKKELVPGGLFSHLSMFVLMFAFLGFMIAANFVLLKAYLLDRCK